MSARQSKTKTAVANASPEAILPRRIRRIEVGGVRVERVLDLDYKAATLCLDEAVLADGQELRCEPPGTPVETALLVIAEGALEAGDTEVRGTAALFCPDGAPARLRARGGRAYVALAYACAKAST